MLKKSVWLAVLCVMVLGLSGVWAQSADAPTTNELRLAMADMLRAIERATGVQTDAPEKIMLVEDEAIEGFFASVDSRHEMIALSGRIIERIEFAAMKTSPVGEKSWSPRGRTTATPPSAYAVSAAYPGWGEIHFEVARSYGLVEYPWDRCGGDAYEDWKESMFWYQYALDQAQPSCVVASCDPTGVICLIDCAIVQVAQIVLNGLKAGTDACVTHDGNVDGAEIEAAYENGLTQSSGVSDLANDLAVHDAKVDRTIRFHNELTYNNLAHHRAVIEPALELHDVEVKATLDALDQTLATEIAPRFVQLEVLEMIPRRRFIVNTMEAGVAVDATLMSVKVSKLLPDMSGFEMVEVSYVATPIAGTAGMLDVTVEMSEELQANAKLFEFRVKDVHFDGSGAPSVEHFGRTVYVTSANTYLVESARRMNAPVKRGR